MSLAPILLIGGSGVVGRSTAGHLRDAYPNLPLLIGGRDLAKAQAVAREVGNAEGVAIDLDAENLGLGEREVSAVAVLIRDDATAALSFAQARGVPHISITSGASEIGPEVAAYVQRPSASVVVLGAEWLVGAVTVPTLEFVKEFGRVNELRIGALLD
ncbi:NAD(P)-dependent oxidoreductase, partial [bacterium]